MTRRRLGVTPAAITLGVVGSMAGNVTWAWTRSPVLVGVGVLMSLVLPVAVRLWRATTGATGWVRAERALVMGFICAGAALYSLIHSTLLLGELGLPGSIAWLPGAVMEALVVQAARAGSPTAVTPTRARRDTSPSRTAPTKNVPQPAVQAAPVTADTAPGGESPEERRRRLAAARQQRARARKREAVAA